MTGSRRKGGGRKSLKVSQPTLQAALNRLVDPATRGDSESLLRWTCKSSRNIASALVGQGFILSRHTVCRLLKCSGYSLQANHKTIEGKQHPDRNAQFEFINKQAHKASRNAQPFLSVDTKKKENIGLYRARGEEWLPKGNPRRVDVHDFPDETRGKVIPYGIYDVATNKGLVNVGTTHDTGEFAVASIALWWRRIGKQSYPDAVDLYITADSGGSNSCRNRSWKYFLQKFATRSGLRIHVRHFPPGTSKWNKVEHRMFCHISANCRATPLVCRETVLSLIGNTRTDTGLTIKAILDTKFYAKGIKITDDQVANLQLFPHKFHSEWNYTICP